MVLRRSGVLLFNDDSSVLCSRGSLSGGSSMLVSRGDSLGLNVNLAALHGPGTIGLDAGLPRRGSQILDAVGVLEHLLRLFKRLPGGFREHEEDMDECNCVEDGEDDVRLPTNVRERRGSEQTQSHVESPVSGRGESHALPTQTKRIQLWRIDPAGRAYRRGEGGDEEICASDQTLGRGAGQTHGRLGNAIDTPGDYDSMACHDAGIGVHEDHHEEETDQERGSTAIPVDEQQGGDGHDDVDDILDG